MPAAASDAPISACNCCWKATSPRPRASPPNWTGSTPSVVSSNRCRRSAGGSRGDGLAGPRGQGLGDRHRGGRLASRRGRPGRLAAEGKVFAAGLSPSRWSRAASAPDRAARSAGVDLGKVVRQAVKDGLLIKGGGPRHGRGHHAAKRASLAEFRGYVEAALADDVAKVASTRRSCSIDGAVTARGVTTDLVATLNRAGPFGAGNPEPVIALPSHQLVYRRRSRAGALCGCASSHQTMARWSTALRFARVGQKLGQRIAGQPWSAIACGGFAHGGSLAGDRARAIPRTGCRGTDA